MTGDRLNSLDEHKLDSEISVKEVFQSILVWIKYLVTKWHFILIAGIVGGGIGLFYAYQQKPLYTAELTFFLEDNEASGGGYAGLASQFGINIGGGGGGAFTGENLIALMQSRSLIEKTLLTPVKIGDRIENTTLAEYFIEFNNLRESWVNKPELKKVNFLHNIDRSTYTLKQDSILGKFYKILVNGPLTVGRRDKDLGIISIKLKSGNETFAKTFVEVLAKVVTDFYVETKTLKSVKNLQILQHQADSVRMSLNSAIEGVAKTADFNPNPNLSKRVLAVPSQKRTVDVQANQAILTELVKNLEISKMSLRRETPLIQVIDRPILPLDIELLGKRKGLLIGGIIGGFLMINYLILKKLFTQL